MTTIIASNILFYSLFLGYFVGGTSWGPRFQYTIIPLMLIPAAYRTIKIGLNKKMFYTLLIAGIFTQIPTIFVNSGQMLHTLQAELEKTSYMGAWELTAFTPQYSPIILGYMQITSAIKSSLGFQSVSLVLIDIRCANLGQISIGSIDYWDLWFTNIMRIGGSVILKLTVVSILLIELAAIVYLFKSLTTGAKDS